MKLSIQFVAYSPHIHYTIGKTAQGDYLLTASDRFQYVGGLSDSEISPVVDFPGKFASLAVCAR